MTGSQDQGRTWYRVIRGSAGTGQPAARIDIFDEIGFWGVSASDFIQDLNAIEGPVEVHLNSPGGEIFEAYPIYNALAARPDVTAVVDGLAASCASLILMAAGTRLGNSLSQVMLHDAWAGTDGNAAALAKLAARLEQASDQMAGVYAAAAGGSKDDWRAVMQAERWYTAEEAVEAGLLTGLLADARVPAPTPRQAAARMPEAGKLAAIVRTHEEWSRKVLDAAAAMPDMEPWDPDGDGDDDSSPETDTDHSHWSADGKQLKSVPGKQMPGQPPAPAGSVRAASVDNSPWDAAKAWANGAASDDPAAFYAGICAGKKAGDPGTQAAHALPYRYHPGDPPNAGAVRNGLSRLPQTEGLTNETEAKALLERLMKEINPDWEPPAGSATAATPSAKEDRVMANDDGLLTIEGRRSRIGDIVARVQELAREYAAAVMPPAIQSEWDQLLAERADHQAAVDQSDHRAAQLAAINGGTPGAHEAPQVSGNGAPGAPAGVARMGAPAVHIQHDIYDVAAIRQRARTHDQLPGLYRDSAMRAIEAARFPGTNREDAQGNVAKLLDTIPDDQEGILARRILNTGSPAYKRVFGRALRSGTPGTLGGHDGQILALGESDTGSYAVPFELDPTVILSSNGAINPLRQVARVERITGKEYDLVTSTGVTVHRRGESSVATDDAPTLVQPTIKAERVDGFIPFSVEIEGDWTGLQATMLRLLTDAKDVEEATGSAGFVLGNGVNSGTAPQAGGIIGSMGTAQQVLTATTATFAVGDVYAIKNACPPRFRAQGSFLAETSIYDLVRQFGTSTMANVWVELGEGLPAKLAGYPARELSSMAAAPISSANLIMLFGDMSQFLIVDRVGMNMELVPHVADPTTGYPQGTRGYYAWWRNNSVILVPNAFRLLKVR